MGNFALVAGICDQRVAVNACEMLIILIVGQLVRDWRRWGVGADISALIEPEDGGVGIALVFSVIAPGWEGLESQTRVVLACTCQLWGDALTVHDPLPLTACIWAASAYSAVEMTVTSRMEIEHNAFLVIVAGLGALLVVRELLDSEVVGWVISAAAGALLNGGCVESPQL